MTWSNTGTNKRKFLEDIYTKATVRQKTTRQDNFGKCSTCHRFSEIFQRIKNRRRNKNSCIFHQKPYSIFFKKWKI